MDREHIVGIAVMVECAVKIWVVYLVICALQKYLAS